MCRVLVKAALNGRAGPPAPLDPLDAAEEGRRAVEAGAGMVHVHARRPDGAETGNPGWYAEFLTAFRARCPKVPVSFTTRQAPGLLDDVRAWDPPPDLASVNVGHGVDPWDELLDALRARGIAIEAGAWDEAMLDAVAADGGELVQLVLVTPGEEDRAGAARRYLDLAAHARSRGFSRRIVAHGYGDATWGVVGTALACGDDVRVGFEDVRWLPDGSEARSNGDLVAAAVRMAQAVGRVPLAPEEVRLREPKGGCG